jgi:hypothetical protein
MSCLNTTRVSGLSILSLVSMLHVPLISPLCVLSQFRMCHWFVPCVSCLNSACVTGLRVVLRQDIWWTNQRHRQHWDETHNGQPRVTSSIGITHRMDKPRHRQICYPNTACVTGLSLLCLVSILPVSLVCPLCVFSQYCLCLWFSPFSVLFQSCLCFGLLVLCLIPMLLVTLVCPLCFSCQYCLSLWFVQQDSELINQRHG